MWLLLKAFALRLVVGRTVGGLFGALFVLMLPVAGALKIAGLPLMLILGTVGTPLFLLLGAVGLPGLLVLGMGGGVLLLLAGLLAMGIFAIKIVLPIVLIVWFVRWMFKRPAAGAGAVSAADSSAT